HQLRPVADAEHGYPQVVERRIRRRSAGVVDARWAAAEDDAGRAPGGYRSSWRVVRQQLAVDAALADAPRDQLAVLGAEVENDYFLGSRVVHSYRYPRRTASAIFTTRTIGATSCTLTAAAPPSTAA